MANSEGHPGADGLEIAAGAQGEHSFVIRAEVHTGETGLNIPELSETASDEELAEFISSVRTAKKTLTNRRMELSAGMDRIRRTSDMNARVMNAGETGENTQQTADLAEDVVELKSSEIGLSLGVSMMGSLQSIREGLAELWN
jgi:hypothetical protein